MQSINLLGEIGEFYTAFIKISFVCQMLIILLVTTQIMACLYILVFIFTLAAE